ncbi:MAG: hypothetical protein CMM53_10760 [Rhodospirillaceae bacterium]|nr:hypothetical protein [Rhodospirillaceae bacterium]
MARSVKEKGSKLGAPDEITREFSLAFRDIREKSGRDLFEVANDLRIREVYLQAIEEGRFDQLPGPTYATGFVRAYATYLGLDVKEVMQCYMEVTNQDNGLKSLSPPSPINEARLPTTFVLLIAAILAASTYGGWYYLTIYGQSSQKLVSELSEYSPELSALDKKTNGNKLPRVTKPSLSNNIKNSNKIIKKELNSKVQLKKGTEKNAVQKNSKWSAELNNKIFLEKKTKVLPIPKVDFKENKNFQNGSNQITNKKIKIGILENKKRLFNKNTKQSNSKYRIVLIAKMTSWVELRDSAGTRLISKILKKGDEYKIPNEAGVTLTTGNAGGIDVLVDGIKIEPLGGIGVVLRDIRMDPEILASDEPKER